MNLSPERLTCSNVTLGKLIMLAYSVKDFQLSGTEWLNSRYTILPLPAASHLHGQFLLMLQSLLAERFQLKLHRETKEVPMYALVVGKTGFEIKEGEFGRSSTSGIAGHLNCQKMPLRSGRLSIGSTGQPRDGHDWNEGILRLHPRMGAGLAAGRGRSHNRYAPGASVFTAVPGTTWAQTGRRKGPVRCSS